MAHASFWPAYRTRKPLDLFITQLEHGWNWRRLKHVVLDNAKRDGYYFVNGPLADQDFFFDVLSDPDVTAFRSGERGIQTFSYLTPDSYRVWIISRSIWGNATIEAIDGAYKHTGVGPVATPAGLGAEVMRSSYSGRNIYRPPWRVWDLLHAQIVGGRVDLVRQGEHFDSLWEYDLNGSYLAQLGRVPGGPVHQVFNKLQTGEEGFDDVATSYRKYLVFASRPVSLGPLPVRLADNSIFYPTEGCWQGWYWKEEIDAARSIGWECSPYEGVYWREWNEGFQTCQTRFWHLRQSAPSADVADVIKLATVAGIGRFASPAMVTTIRQGSGSPYVDPIRGPVDGLEEVTERQDREGLLIHIASYVWAQGRLALWRMAKPLADDGLLVATDYDAVYTPKSGLGTGTGLGDWKAKQLHNVTIPQARTVLSDEKVRMPGVPLIGRES